MGRLKMILKEKLEDVGVTRYRLAKDIDINYETINGLYNDRVNRFDGIILAKICEYLKCDLSEILVYDNGET